MQDIWPISLQHKLLTLQFQIKIKQNPILQLPTLLLINYKDHEILK